MTGCANDTQEVVTLADAASFAATIDGQDVQLYTIYSKGARNLKQAIRKKAIIVQICNYGARIVSVFTPDKNGHYDNVSLGYASLDHYLNNNGERYLGPIVGRYGNRIAKGQFVLDSTLYSLPVNNNGQCLHGGLIGVDSVPWEVVEVSENKIVMTLLSPDGSDGFPGNVQIRVQYYAGSSNDLQIYYKATTDKPTVLNLTNHAFFNLHGEGQGTILDHTMMINADAIIPIDSVLIPQGPPMPVEGTPFDFRIPTVIGQRINRDHPQLINGKGYDHTWVLTRKSNAPAVALAVRVTEPVSGRTLEVRTDQPGVQFYSGNFFDGKGIGASGKPIGLREGLALETQCFPDSPNRPDFPSTRLDPGQIYTHNCIYTFLP